MKPKIVPGPRVPKKSPMVLPIAEPHAAAGPNINEQITGITLAGLTSVKPGISGIAILNGMRIAAYIAAVIRC